MTSQPGLRVLVTAGASGIGHAIAMAFARDGARVHVCDIDAAGLSAVDHPSVTGTCADVADEADVDRLFADVAASLGGLDVLVNNAGIGGPSGRIDTLDPAEWRRTIDVNLTGHFLCTRLAVPMLLQAGGGAVVNMSSVAGRLAYPGRTPYAASKWGIIGLTQTLAAELGPAGIRVNAILPGVVAGPRIERVIEGRARAEGVTAADMRRRLLEKVSMRRMVTGEEVAAMVLFLCSPAGRNISGQSLGVCGHVEAL